MAYKVRYTPQSLGDLDFIFKDIAEHNLRAAGAVKSRIRKRIDSLALFPMSGPETATPGLRMLVVGRYPYLIFMPLARDSVEIVRVIHGKRDLKRALRD